MHFNTNLNRDKSENVSQIENEYKGEECGRILSQLKPKVKILLFIWKVCKAVAKHPDTVLDAINLYCMFLENNEAISSELMSRIAACACVWVSSKYNDVNVEPIYCFGKFLGNAEFKKTMIRFEKTILDHIGWNIKQNRIHNYVEIYLDKLDVPPCIVNTARKLYIISYIEFHDKDVNMREIACFSIIAAACRPYSHAALERIKVKEWIDKVSQASDVSKRKLTRGMRKRVGRYIITPWYRYTFMLKKSRNGKYFFL